MSEDNIEIKAQDLIKQIEEENKKKEEKFGRGNSSDTFSKKATKEDLSSDDPNRFSKKNTVVNKRRKSKDSNSSSDSDSQDSSPQGSEEEKKNDNKKIEIVKKERSNSITTDSSLENLMISHDLNIRLFTSISCIFCVGTTILSIIGSLLDVQLLTFKKIDENENENAKNVLNKIMMDKVMIYILLGIIACFNFGLFIMISSNSDHMLTKLIFAEINWFFVLTQFSFGSLFLITLIWDVDLWTINVCLSISMLAILFLAFYFTEIKQKKNMSLGTLIFIYIYISVLFSFISYFTLFNISCILMENMEVQIDKEIIKWIKIIIKAGISGGQTILSFVLLTYFKDVFFAFTSGYIVFSLIVKNILKPEIDDIISLIMVSSIILGIALTFCRYGLKAIGKENVQLGIIKD
jgi:hypothetical protein